MDGKNYLRVMTKQNTFRINALSELDQAGSLVKFYADGLIELVVQNEDFLSCELIKGE